MNILWNPHLLSTFWAILGGDFLAWPTYAVNALIICLLRTDQVNLVQALTVSLVIASFAASKITFMRKPAQSIWKLTGGLTLGYIFLPHLMLIGGIAAIIAGGRQLMTGNTGQQPNRSNR